MAAAREDHTRVVFISLLLAGMAFALSQTVVSPALPEIQRQYGADPASAAWILTGYLLAASVATPIVGKLGDLFGRGKVLTIVLLVFAAGSAVCALAPSLAVLVLGRVIQGVGGGIFPLAFGIIRETFPPERVATAIGGATPPFGIGGGGGRRDRRDQRHVRHRRRRRAGHRGPDRPGAERLLAVLARSDGPARGVR